MTAIEAARLAPIFTVAEIEASGARLEDVRYRTMAMAKRFREYAGAPLRIVYGGLTSGAHVSGSYHYTGRAVDLAPVGGSMPCSADDAIVYAVAAGARGIGLYSAGGRQSIHMDTRQDPAIWCARPDVRDPSRWAYIALTDIWK